MKEVLNQSFVGEGDRITDYIVGDVYGNVWQTTDGRGNISYSDFDPQYFSLFAYRERGPNTGVSHEVLIETDLRYGQPKSITDENGQVTTRTYDQVGRLTCEARPGAQCPLDPVATCISSGGSFTASTLLCYRYADPGGTFEGRHSSVEMRRRTPSNLNGFTSETVFIDALGRERFRTEQVAVAGTLQTVVREQTRFDSGGRRASVYGPYLRGGSRRDPDRPATSQIRLSAELFLQPASGDRSARAAARRHRER